MNDSVKVAGLCMSGLLSLGFAALGEMVFAKAFAGVFGAILGLPVIGQGIRKLVK